MSDIFLNSEPLRRALNEHPDLPLVVFCEDELCGEYRWTSANSMRVEVGELFDCIDCPYCPDDFEMYTDRGDWKMAMESALEDREDCSEDEWKAFCRGEGKIWEQCQAYWRPAILVFVGT